MARYAQGKLWSLGHRLHWHIPFWSMRLSANALFEFNPHLGLSQQKKTYWLLLKSVFGVYTRIHFAEGSTTDSACDKAECLN